MAKSATVGRLNVKMTSNTMGFTKGMRGARRATKQTQTTMQKLKSFLPALGLGFIGVAAAIGTAKRVFGKLGQVIEVARKRIDVLAKASSKLGLTTEALSRLHHAATITGVATATFDMALQRMTRRLAEAAQGTGEAVNALVELGLNASELVQLSPDVAFTLIAEAMSKVANQSDRVRLAFKLFDSEGVALVNTLALGADGLARMGKESDRLGTTISGTLATQMELLTDATARSTAAWKGFGNVLAEKTSTVRTFFSELSQGIGTLAADLTKGLEWEKIVPGIRIGKAIRDLLDPEGTEQRAELAQAKAFAAAGFGGPGMPTPATKAVPQTDPFVTKWKEGVADKAAAERIRLDAAFDRSRKLVIAMRTPMEQYEDALAGINRLNKQGMFWGDEYNKVLAGLKEQFKDVLDPAVKLKEELASPVRLGPVQLSPSMELGSAAAAQASFRAGATPGGTEQAVKQLLVQATEARPKDDRRNDTLAKILYAMEHQPIVRMG